MKLRYYTMKDPSFSRLIPVLDYNDVELEKVIPDEVSMECKMKIWKKLEYKNGVVYHKDTKMIYTGTEITYLTCSKGDLQYKGTLKNGRLNGKGMFFSKFFKSLRYKGDLVNGIPNGKGQTHDGDRLIYDGDFQMGIANGWGKLHYINNQMGFEGKFKNGKCNGIGKYYDFSGRLIYEGNFLDNKFNGYGVYYNDNENIKYSGIFINDKFEGHRFLSKKWNFNCMFN